MKTYPISVYRALKHGDIYPFLEKLEDYDTARSYGEPGYDEPDEGSLIIFANWNDVPTAIQDLLTELGHHLEWVDEWIILDDDTAYRTEPDSYSWQPTAVYDGECDHWWTPKDSLEDIVEAFKSTDYNQPHKAIPDTLLSDPAALEEMGYEKYTPMYRNRYGYETGFHLGQTDNPTEIAKMAQEAGYSEFVFRLIEQSQFYTRWEVYVK